MVCFVHKSFSSVLNDFQLVHKSFSSVHNDFQSILRLLWMNLPYGRTDAYRRADDTSFCHIECRSSFQCWWLSRLICCKSGAFLLGGLIHADYTFLHIQCSRAFILCWQISRHICCKSRATFMSVGASICPQTGQTGKIGFQILKS